MIKPFQNPYQRTIAFPFFMAVFSVLLESAATGFLMVCAVYLIFFNPNGSTRSIFEESWLLIKRVSILIVIPVFLGWLCLTSFITGPPYAALSKIAAHWQLFIIIPAAVGLVRLTPEINSLRIYSLGCRIALPIAFFLALYQVTILNMRPNGLGGNALVLASICGITAGLTLPRWSESDPKLSYSITIFAFILGLATVLLTFSRGMIPVVILTIFIGVLYQIKTFRFSKNHLAIFGLIILLPLLLWASGFYSDSIVKLYNIRIAIPFDDLTNGKINDESFQQRLEMQLIGLEAFLQKPWLGHGLQNAVAAANLASPEALGRETTYGFSHLHNEYLMHMVGGGIPLLLGFLMLLIMPVIIAFGMPASQNRRDTLYSAVFLTSSCMLIGVTNVVLRNDQTSTLIASIMILILASRIQADNGVNAPKTPSLKEFMKAQEPK